MVVSYWDDDLDVRERCIGEVYNFWCFFGFWVNRKNIYF